MSEIMNLTSICRCCHKDGQFKGLLSPYLCDGSVDVYANIMFETFGIALKYPPCEASFSICDECISQLKQAYYFKMQVLSCELKFAEYCKNELGGLVKVEMENEDEVPDNTADEIDNDQDLTDVECKKNIDFGKGDSQEPLKVEVKKDGQVEIKLEPILEEEVKKEKCKITVKSVPESTVKRVVKRKRPAIRVKQKTQKDEGGVKLGPSEAESSKNSLLCRKCNIKFDNNDDFQTHKRKIHESRRCRNNKYKCEICKENLLFTNETIFVKHMGETHNVDKPFKCTYCEKRYRSLFLLQCHINSHEERNFYQCDFCGKKFYSKSSISVHLKLHYEVTKKHICDLCGWSFNDTTNLRKHIAGVHENLRPFSCTFCDKTFKYKKQCTEHLRTHTGELFNCELCGSGFVSKYHLERHTQEKHTSKNMFKCTICQKQLSNKRCYLRHLRVHTNDLPYNCTLCPRAFSCKFVLNRHMESHDGIKKFKCDACGKKFTAKASMDRHIQNLHVAERNVYHCEKCNSNVLKLETHKCNVKKVKCHPCNKYYTNNSALNRHVRIKHLGLKTHVCNLCAEKFTKKAGLVKHMQRKHNINNMEDEVVAYAISKS